MSQTLKRRYEPLNKGSMISKLENAHVNYQVHGYTRDSLSRQALAARG